MTGPAAARAFFTCVIHVSNSVFQRVTALQEAWDQHCRKVSPITLVLQYRFATPKFLRACPGPWGCETAPLCNCVLVDSPPRYGGGAAHNPGFGFSDPWIFCFHRASRSYYLS